MTIFVGSQNPVKIEAAILASKDRWPDVEVIGVKVESGVAEQPLFDQETRDGAKIRAKLALEIGLGVKLDLIAKLAKKADPKHLGLGFEGGVFTKNKNSRLSHNQELWNTVWVAVTDQFGRSIEVNGARFKLPDFLAKRIWQGEVMGPIFDELIGDKNISTKQGMIGVLTNNYVNRTSEYLYLARLAIGLWLGENLNKTMDLKNTEMIYVRQ